MIMARRRQSDRMAWWGIWLLCCVPLAAAPLLLTLHGDRTPAREIEPIRPSDLLPGMTVEPMASGRGLVVTSLRSGGEAAARGIAVGDAIDAINGHRVATLDEAAACLHNHAGAAIALGIIHDRHARIVDIVMRNGAEG